MDSEWFRQQWGRLSLKHTDGSAQRCIERVSQAVGMAPQVIIVDLTTTSRDYFPAEHIRLESSADNVSGDAVIETKVTEHCDSPRRQLHIALSTFSTRS